jgi:hypothetical protein
MQDAISLNRRGYGERKLKILTIREVASVEQELGKYPQSVPAYFGS